jgi:hypothetical protein
VHDARVLAPGETLGRRYTAPARANLSRLSAFTPGPFASPGRQESIHRWEESVKSLQESAAPVASARCPDSATPELTVVAGGQQHPGLAFGGPLSETPPPALRDGLDHVRQFGINQLTPCARGVLAHDNVTQPSER